MTEQDWLTSTDPRAMLRWLNDVDCDGHGGRAMPPSDRKLRLFAVACAGDPESGGSWNEWGDDDPTVKVAGYFSSLDGARYWVGEKVGQNYVHKHQPGESATQAALLRDIFGNPWKPVLVHNWAWEGGGLIQDHITPTVLAIAHEIYEARAFDQIPILADALEESGCREEAILRHLRATCFACTDKTGFCWGQVADCNTCQGTGAALHVRGCWALDLILGRER